MRFTPRKITILIMGMVFAAGLIMGFGGYVFAGENYNSSRSNTSTGIVNQQVGDILLRYGIGGAEINEVTNALAVGISTVDLKAMLVKFGVSDAGITEVFAELDRLGTGSNIAIPDDQVERTTSEVSTPDAGGAVPSSANGTIKEILPSKRAEPASSEDDKTTQPSTTGAKRSKTTEAKVVLGGIKTSEEIFVGDFTGDGKADVAIHDKQTGDWFVGRSTGSSFTVETWVSNFGNRGSGLEEIFVGDFTGDGKADVAIHDRQSGDWFVGRSTGSSFAIQPATSQQEDGSREGNAALQAQRKYRRVLLQQVVQESRKALKENAKELRDNFRRLPTGSENVKATIGHVDHGKTARIAVAHGKGLRMINRFRSAMARFDHILGRLESRIEKIGIEIKAESRAKGKIESLFPPTSMAILIEEAKNMQAENEAKLVQLQAKYESLLLSESPFGQDKEGKPVKTDVKKDFSFTTQRIGEEARQIAQELKAEIENLHVKLREISLGIPTVRLEINLR